VTQHNTTSLGPGNTASFSGYVTASTRNHFYWFFESRAGNASTAPTILWLAGAPGCGSLEAALMQMGPYALNASQPAPKTCSAPSSPPGQAGKDGLSLNPHSWNNFANVLFIDVFLGQGLSFDSTGSAPGVGDTSLLQDSRRIVPSEDSMARHIWQFLVEWFKAHGKYAGTQLYIAAESYGAHYGAALASYIKYRNSGASEGSPYRLILQGLLLGDAFVDMLSRYTLALELMRSRRHSVPSARLPGPCLPLQSCGHSYGQQSCQWCRSPYSATGACSPPPGDTSDIPCCLKGDGLPCDGQTPNYFACPVDSNSNSSSSTAIRLYVTCEQCLNTPVCNNLAAQRQWLATPCFAQRLGAQVNDVCADATGLEVFFSEGWMGRFKESMQSVLDGHFDVLLLHGAADGVRNAIQGESWLDALSWHGTQGFSQAVVMPYTIAGLKVGTHRRFGKLSVVEIDDAGHRFLVDKPEVAADITKSFIGSTLEPPLSSMLLEATSTAEVG